MTEATKKVEASGQEPAATTDNKPIVTRVRRLDPDRQSAIWQAEDESDAQWQVENAATTARRATLTLTREEWAHARATGLNNADARYAKDLYLSPSTPFRTFSEAVAFISKCEQERRVKADKDTARKAKLEAEKQRRPGENDAEWKARAKHVDKREADRVRRAPWRLHRAYLETCHGVPRSSSHSGTPGNKRNKQQPPEYYVMKEVMKQLNAINGAEELAAKLESAARGMERYEDEEAGLDFGAAASILRTLARDRRKQLAAMSPSLKVEREGSEFQGRNLMTDDDVYVIEHNRERGGERAGNGLNLKNRKRAADAIVEKIMAHRATKKS
jgi:hypothetical protein